MKHIVVLVVIQMLITNAFAAVGVDCSGGAEACADTIEQCVSSTSCECATNHINKATGVCISNDCSSTACSTSGILNTYCDTNSVCVCDALSEVSTAADNTKGACVKKSCTANGNECGSDVTIECASSVCACATAHTMTNGICQADSIGGTCSSDASCAGITDAVCDTMATSSVCKLAVGKTCSTTTDNCVTNAECDSSTTKCKCKTNYVADSTGNLCTAQSSAGMIAASVGALLLTLLLQVSLL